MQHGPLDGVAESPGSFGASGSFLNQLSSSTPNTMFGTSPYRSGQDLGPPGQKRNTPSLPPPVRLDLTDLDGQLLQLAESLAPSAEQRQRQQQAWGSVQGLLQALWPDASVHLFGSAANELDIGGSNDLDVCLELEGVEETKEARGG
jgi:DNA polymerase sigma